MQGQGGLPINPRREQPPEELVWADGEAGVDKDFQKMSCVKDDGSGSGPNREGRGSDYLLKGVLFQPLLNTALGIINIQLGENYESR